MPLDDAMDWEVMGPKYRQRMIELQVENARLQRELAECQVGWETGAVAIADNARLRAALREIAEHRIDSAMASREKRGMARDALNEQSTPSCSHFWAPDASGKR